MLDVIFFRTPRGNEPVRVWLSNLGQEDGNIIDWECVIMNKYHGSKFEEYLKEKGTFEETSVLAQKRWEELQTEEPEEPPSEIAEDLPKRINRFFQWLRHAINNLVS